MVKHPIILWAQSTSEIFLTVELEFKSFESLVIEGNLFKLKGRKDSEDYEADFELFAKLKSSNFRQKNTDRRIEFAIPKEVPGWWPRLLKDSTKVPWIKVDFDKWKDKEEKDDEEEGVDKLFQRRTPFDKSMFNFIIGARYSVKVKQLEGVQITWKEKIYRDVDDDSRKAMMKSFSESCGTVLSTNWSQISQQKTEVKPPDGMEFKKYDK